MGHNWKIVRDIAGKLVSVEWVKGYTKTQPGVLPRWIEDFHKCCSSRKVNDVL